MTLPFLLLFFFIKKCYVSKNKKRRFEYDRKKDWRGR